MNATDYILRRADADAEQLLGVVRMAVAIALAVALAFAINAPNRPTSSILESQLVIAQVVIGSYFALGLASYLIVRFGRYQLWMAWLSAILDVLLICSNVWLSLINAELSSLYAFLFPSVLLLPAILAFGALRFRPSIQLTVTLLAATLLILIVFSNQAATVPDAFLLRRVETTFGIPPNVVRIVMILATGLIITLAVYRAKRLLKRIVSESQQRANLIRFLPRGIARDMSNDALHRLQAGRQVDLAIMFIDIRGFTRLIEHMNPTDASRLLTNFRSDILDVCEAHHGIVDKFIGDGALVLFGLESQPSLAAGHAIKAAEALADRIAERNLERSHTGAAAIAVGIGVHFGNVVVGAVGDQRRLEFTVIGDEVNVASRIEQTTKTTGYCILVSDAAMQAAAVQPGEGWTDLGDTVLRGRETPVHLWAGTKMST